MRTPNTKKKKKKTTQKETNVHFNYPYCAREPTAEQALNEKLWETHNDQCTINGTIHTS